MPEINKELGREFCRILNEWLTPEQMQEVNARNEADRMSSDTCATHDFCDSNQAMIDALESIGLVYPLIEEGRDELTAEQEELLEVVNNTWDACKHARFKVSDFDKNNIRLGAYDLSITKSADSFNGLLYNGTELIACFAAGLNEGETVLIEKAKKKIKSLERSGNKITEINFFPAAAMAPWDGDLEVSPVIKEGDVCEVCEEGEESFWSVYAHQVAGGVQCIADLPSKESAQTFAELITNLMASKK